MLGCFLVELFLPALRNDLVKASATLLGEHQVEGAVAPVVFGERAVQVAKPDALVVLILDANPVHRPRRATQRLVFRQLAAANLAKLCHLNRAAVYIIALEVVARVPIGNLRRL